MSSLSVHLRQAEDHSTLPFHPSCPVCRRDRLAGSLSGDELVSRRTQAAIAAGLLAFSGMGAPAAVASGPDEEIEGSTEVVEGGDPESLDLGEASDSLPDAAAVVPDDAEVPTASEEDVALETESVDEGVEPSLEASGEPVAPQPDPAPASEPVAVVAPPAETPAATNEPEPVPSVGAKVDESGGTKRERPAERPRQSEPAARQLVAAAPAPAAAPTTTAVTPPVTVRVVAGTSASTGHASPGERFHVVRPGESLWSIASDLLGDRATVSRVAREVNRLWELNDDRIATGSPDLLFAGTRLRLR